MSKAVEYRCEFCQGEFGTKSALKIHSTSAKYCLELQGKHKEQTQVCTFCDKVVSNRYNMDTHYTFCIPKVRADLTREYEAKIQTLTVTYEQRISDLKERLDKMDNVVAKSGTINNNNNTVNNNTTNHNHQKIINIIQTPVDLSVKHVKQVLEKFLTKEVVGDGQKGFAKMIYKRLLTDLNGRPMYMCTDKGRHNFAYMNRHGHLEKDIKATKLRTALTEADLCEKVTNILKEIESKSEEFQYYWDMGMELSNIEHNDAKFRKTLASMGKDISHENEDEDSDEDEDEDDVEDGM